jgi:hypothetical protein
MPPLNDATFCAQQGRCARQTIAQLRRVLRPVLGRTRAFGGVVVDLFELRAKNASVIEQGCAYLVRFNDPAS